MGLLPARRFAGGIRGAAKIFKFRSCTLDIRVDDEKRRFFRPCILHSINQCVAPCGARIEKAEYKTIIKDLIKFLQSKRATALRQLKKEMEEASAKMDYEKAGMLLDRIRLIGKLDERGEPDEDVQPRGVRSGADGGISETAKVLDSPNPGESSREWISPTSAAKRRWGHW